MSKRSEEGNYSKRNTSCPVLLACSKSEAEKWKVQSGASLQHVSDAGLVGSHWKILRGMA